MLSLRTKLVTPAEDMDLMMRSGQSQSPLLETSFDVTSGEPAAAQGRALLFSAEAPVPRILDGTHLSPYRQPIMVDGIEVGTDFVAAEGSAAPMGGLPVARTSLSEGACAAAEEWYLHQLKRRGFSGIRGASPAVPLGLRSWILGAGPFCRVPYIR